jgi:antitoxin YefM
VPIIINGKRVNTVLISEDDWRAIQETLNLLSVPNMRESIVTGMKEPVSKCKDVCLWQNAKQRKNPSTEN